MSKINNGDVNNVKDIDLNRTQQLQLAGWEQRNVIDEPRLSELVELYETLGLEVHLEPLSPEFLKAQVDMCESCYSGQWKEFKVIFTRENMIKK